MNPSNVRRDIWSKLLARAGVRALDMYSLRHTFRQPLDVFPDSAV